MSQREESESEDRHDGVFVEIDEGDPFDALELRVVGENEVQFVAGGLDAKPGRYELRRVEDD